REQGDVPAGSPDEVAKPFLLLLLPGCGNQVLVEAQTRIDALTSQYCLHERSIAIWAGRNPEAPVIHGQVFLEGQEEGFAFPDSPGVASRHDLELQLQAGMNLGGIEPGKSPGSEPKSFSVFRDQRSFATRRVPKLHLADRH